MKLETETQAKLKNGPITTPYILLKTNSVKEKEIKVKTSQLNQ